jgi:hypothetical protein
LQQGFGQVGLVLPDRQVLLELDGDAVGRLARRFAVRVAGLLDDGEHRIAHLQGGRVDRRPAGQEAMRTAPHRATDAEVQAVVGPEVFDAVGLVEFEMEVEGVPVEAVIDRGN